jgi:hypothetical protein
MRPDAFAAVMATAIVSVAAADHGMTVVSVALAVIAVVALPVLVFVTSVVWKRDSWKLGDLDTRSACSPTSPRAACWRPGSIHTRWWCWFSAAWLYKGGCA